MSISPVPSISPPPLQQTSQADRILNLPGEYFAAQLLADLPIAVRSPDSLTLQAAFESKPKEILPLSDSRYSMKLVGSKTAELDIPIDVQSYPLRTLPYEDWYNYEGFRSFIDQSSFYSKRYAHFHKHIIQADIRTAPYEPLWLASDSNLSLYRNYYDNTTRRLRGKLCPVSPHQAYAGISHLIYIAFSFASFAIYFMDVNYMRTPLHRIVMSEDWWLLNERRRTAALRFLNVKSYIA